MAQVVFELAHRADARYVKSNTTPDGVCLCAGAAGGERRRDGRTRVLHGRGEADGQLSAPAAAGRARHPVLVSSAAAAAAAGDRVMVMLLLACKNAMIQFRRLFSQPVSTK